MKIKKIVLLCAVVALPSLLLAQDPQQTDATVNAPEIQGNSGFTKRLIDFSVLGASDASDFLALENWNVKLNPSSDYLYDKRFTYSKKVQSQSGKFFLGVRSHFPKVDANSFAIAAPRYGMGFYDPETGTVQNTTGRGVIGNVGAIISARTRVAGRNYPHSMIVNMIRNNGDEIKVEFGSLLFPGWAELNWNNPAYLSDFRDREFFVTPLYPRLLPSIRFQNIIFFKQRADLTGNFVTYVDWIDLTYDEYYAQEVLDQISGEEDFINDEDVWKIIQRESGSAEGKLLKKRIEDYKRLERLERQKMNLPVEGVLPNGTENISPTLPPQQ